MERSSRRPRISSLLLQRVLQGVLQGVLLGVLLGTGLMAQDKDLAVGSAFSGRLGFDLRSQYFYRGIQQENQGVIFQPWLEMDAAIYRGGDGGLEAADVRIGIFNSLHDGPTGTGGGRSMWYEGDFYTGVRLRFAEKMLLDTTYLAVSGPNGRLGNTQELSFRAVWDDREDWEQGTFRGFRPSATLAFELAGGRDQGVGQGKYFELAVEPSMVFLEKESYPLTITAPVLLGLNLEDYYQSSPAAGSDSRVGYLQLGGDISTPLPFIPERYGLWKVNFALDFLFLGAGAERMNGGDSFEVIGTLGFQLDW